MSYLVWTGLHVAEDIVLDADLRYSALKKGLFQQFSAKMPDKN